MATLALGALAEAFGDVVEGDDVRRREAVGLWQWTGQACPAWHRLERIAGCSQDRLQRVCAGSALGVGIGAQLMFTCLLAVREEEVAAQAPELVAGDGDEDDDDDDGKDGRRSGSGGRRRR